MQHDFLSCLSFISKVSSSTFIYFTAHALWSVETFPEIILVSPVTQLGHWPHTRDHWNSLILHVDSHDVVNR